MHVMDDKKGTMGDLVARISIFAEPLCQASNITFEKNIPDFLLKYYLRPEEKKNLYLIIKEAINNAVKYRGGNKIQITASVSKGKLRVAIIDNGKGFNTSTAAAGNGLINMRLRAKTDSLPR